MMQAHIPVALFDRLLDEEISPRESVCRELSRMFSSRAPVNADTLPALLAWGVPEWQGLNAGDERAINGFCRQLRTAILRHEPRLKALRVSVNLTQHHGLTLHLDAILWDESAPLNLVLDYQNGGWQ